MCRAFLSKLRRPPPRVPAGLENDPDMPSIHVPIDGVYEVPFLQTLDTRAPASSLAGLPERLFFLVMWCR